jgi:hypothetical protein
MAGAVSTPVPNNPNTHSRARPERRRFAGRVLGEPGGQCTPRRIGNAA